MAETGGKTAGCHKCGKNGDVTRVKEAQDEAKTCVWVPQLAAAALAEWNGKKRVKIRESKCIGRSAEKALEGSMNGREFFAAVKHIWLAAKRIGNSGILRKMKTLFGIP